MHTVQMTVTPAMAEQWLRENNTRNRRLAKSRVDMYAADMRAGNWHLTHQGIAFFDDGTFADGQHRLAAVVKTGVEIETLVTFGVKKPASIAVDANRPRKSVDRISIALGDTWIGNSEAAVATVMRRCGGGSQASDAMTDEQIIKFCMENEAAFLFIKENMPKTIRHITTAPVKAAVLCAYGNVDKRRLAEFCAVMMTGVMESKADISAIRLREQLARRAQEKTQDSSARKQTVLIAQRAIRAFCAREGLQRLIAPETPVYPFPSTAF